MNKRQQRFKKKTIISHRNIIQRINIILGECINYIITYGGNYTLYRQWASILIPGGRSWRHRSEKIGGGEFG